MLAREKDKLEALRSIKAAFLIGRSEKSADHVLTEAEELKIIQKLVKQRQDSADIYRQQGRDDLYKKEMFEFEIINQYMPAQMTEEEVRKFLKELITKLGASSIQQMGQVMGQATKELSGKADGKMISGIVRELLS